MVATNSVRRSILSRVAPVMGAAAISLLCATAVPAAVLHGSLSTSRGASILDDELATLINAYIDPDVQRLIVLAQCYGGNTSVRGFPALTALNTTVISATSPGELAYYGGYDRAAAAALRPGAGRTAQSVHDAGVANRDPRETPSTGGKIQPGNFSLEETSVVGPIQSRHVLIYAGSPDAGNGTSDVAQRNTIRTNFAGKVNTTVRTVGGPGGGGWDYAGTVAGLRQALAAIGAEISKPGVDPTKEQFVLYVGDHGDLERRQPVGKKIVSNAKEVLTTGFETFLQTELNPLDLAQDLANLPGFSIFIPFDSSLQVSVPTTTYFNPGDWQLFLTNPFGDEFVLSNAFDLYYELDDDGIVGNSLGEGFEVWFQLPFLDDTPQFLNSFFGTSYDVSLMNHTNRDYWVDVFAQDTGSMMKLAGVPEPASAVLWVLAGTLAAVFCRRRAR